MSVLAIVTTLKHTSYVAERNPVSFLSSPSPSKGSDNPLKWIIGSNCNNSLTTAWRRPATAHAPPDWNRAPNDPSWFRSIPGCETIRTSWYSLDQRRQGIPISQSTQDDTTHQQREFYSYISIKFRGESRTYCYLQCWNFILNLCNKKRA